MMHHSPWRDIATERERERGREGGRERGREGREREGRREEGREREGERGRIDNRTLMCTHMTSGRVYHYGA